MKRNFVELIEKGRSTEKSIIQFKVVDVKNVEFESTTLDQDVCFEKSSDRGRASKDDAFRFTRFQGQTSRAADLGKIGLKAPLSMTAFMKTLKRGIAPAPRRTTSHIGRK